MVIQETLRQISGMIAEDQDRLCIDSAAISRANRQGREQKSNQAMTINRDIRRSIAELKQRLYMLDQERKDIKDRLVELRALAAAQTSALAGAVPAPSVAMAATTAAKIALFRNLFRGR
ncbi:MAG: hypothetical protein HC850_05060 [Rhodomicrobium sp.]|nr:hypothetical protein [Rhodomicrobium sp.]